MMRFFNRKPDPKIVTWGFINPDATITTVQGLPECVDDILTKACLREPNARPFIVADGGTRAGSSVEMDWNNVAGTKLDDGWFIRAGMLVPVLGPQGKRLYGYAFLTDSPIGRSIRSHWDFKWAAPINGDDDTATAFMITIDDIPKLVRAVLAQMLAQVRSTLVAKSPKTNTEEVAGADTVDAALSDKSAYAPDTTDPEQPTVALVTTDPEQPAVALVVADPEQPPVVQNAITAEQAQVANAPAPIRSGVRQKIKVKKNSPHPSITSTPVTVTNAVGVRRKIKATTVDAADTESTTMRLVAVALKI